MHTRPFGRTGLEVPILAFATSDAPRAVSLLTETPGIVDVTMFGRVVHAVVADEADARAALPGVLAAHGLPCDQLARIAPSLEDVFAAYVRQAGGAVAG